MDGRVLILSAWFCLLLATRASALSIRQALVYALVANVASIAAGYVAVEIRWRGH
jgi:hypothetical protein